MDRFENIGLTIIAIFIVGFIGLAIFGISRDYKTASIVKEWCLDNGYNYVGRTSEKSKFFCVDAKTRNLVLPPYYDNR